MSPRPDVAGAVLVVALASGGIAAGLLSAGCWKPVEFDHPPIVLVDVDTLRADHLGVYGYSRDTSPEIDRFAAEAVRFEWAFSQAPNTPPSQATILTGLYPSSHGRIGDDQVLPEDVVTLAERLSEAGYRTAAFVDGGLMARGFGLEQGFEVYDDEAGGVEAITRRAMGWLTEQTGPFFLLLHSYDVHSPYEDTPLPYRDRFVDDVAELPSKEFARRLSARMEASWNARHDDPPRPLSPVELEYAKAIYDGGIAHVDAWFGVLRRDLENLGLWDHAIVVFLSDHGDEFQEHGGLFHDRLYTTITRIPLIMKLPGNEAGRVVSAPVESVDLVPTLLDILGLPVTPDLEGDSLAVALAGAEPTHGLALGESPFYGRRLFLATSTHRLLLTQSTGEAELYAYRDDPLELVDRSREEPEVAARMRHGLLRWAELQRRTRRSGDRVHSLRPETVRQLEALGYL